MARRTADSGRTRLRADRLEVGRCLERGQLPALPRAVIHAARAVETGPAHVTPSGTAVAYLTSVDHQVVRLGSQGLQIDRILGATGGSGDFRLCRHSYRVHPLLPVGAYALVRAKLLVAVSEVDQYNHVVLVVAHHGTCAK
jgi:hypothetical protein